MRRLSRIVGIAAPVPDLVAHLASIHAQEIAHSGRTLLTHLRGTYDHLARWGCAKTVCRAGLFHSIYGTQIFKKQTVPYEKRAEIRALIGRRAESLAYLFSVSDRPEGLISAIASGTLRDLVHGIDISVSTRDIQDLLCIECANLLDQQTGSQFAQRAVAEIARTGFPVTRPLRLALSALRDPTNR